MLANRWLLNRATLLGVCALLCGCLQTAAADASFDPCSLVTKAEIEKALGSGATMNSTRNPRTGMNECRLKPGSMKGITEIIMVVHPATGWETTKKTFMASDAKQVPGLGDDAFVARFLGYNVRKGNRYVQVFGDMRNEGKANDKATRYLAERAASRM